MDVVTMMVESMVRYIAEGLRKPGIMSVIGIRRERMATKDVAGYFRLLDTRIKAANLEQLAKLTDKAIARHHAEITIGNITRRLSTTFTGVLSANLYEALLEGAAVTKVPKSLIRTKTPLKESIVSGDLEEGDDDSDQVDPLGGVDAQVLSGVPGVLPAYQALDQLGMTGEQAASWAADYAAQQVTGIDNTTRQLLADLTEKAIEDRLGVDGLAKLIADQLEGFSSQRAAMIATTEMNAAFSEAALRKLRRLDVEYKQVILAPGACPTCEENAAIGAIPIEDEFPSGDDRSPFHPWCRCATTAARPPEEDTVQ